MPKQKRTLAPSTTRAAELEQAARQVVNPPSQSAESDQQLARLSTELEAQISAVHALRAELARLEQINQEVSGASQQSEKAFRLRLGALEGVVAETAALLASRTADLEISHAEVTALRQRVRKHQEAGQSDRQADLGALDERRRALETAHHEQLEKLHIQLAHQQLLAESRARESEDLRRQIDTLQVQLARLGCVNQELAQQHGQCVTAEQALRGQAENLEKQLAENLNTTQVTLARQLAQAGPASGAQADGALVRNAKSDERRSLAQPHNRRWRFSLAQKRRWKS